jgi:outer membrane lipoprotein carrier protein
MNATLVSLLSMSLLALAPGLSGAGERALSEVLLSQNPSEAEPAKQPAWRPEKSSEVLLLVQAYYDGAKDLEAKFKQTYWNPTYGEAKKTSGKLKLKKPGKMVWDYKDGQDADYYANGKDLWMVEHDTRQVIKTAVSGNSEVDAALKFLFGGKALTKDFQTRYASDKRVERYGDAEHYVVEIRPKKKNEHYEAVLLVVHATTGRVDSFVVYNTDGSSNYFQLQKIKTNVGLTDKLFDFKLPEGYVETTEALDESAPSVDE